MASQTIVKLFQVTLLAGDTLIYTCPPLTTAIVTALYKTNTDTVSRTFRLHVVDSGGAIANGNAIYFDEPMAAKRCHPRIDTGIVLEPGDMLRGLGSAATIVLTGFGITIVEAA